MISSVFLGTPASAVPSLQELNTISAVDLVVTQPDRARGRSKRPQPSPVKLAAIEMGLAVAQPQSRTELLNVLVEASPFDVGVVVAYGMILRPEVLEIPRKGFVNVHFSLLPRWRGAAPVERAVLDGDLTSGVTLMAVDEGLDTGSIISSTSIEIAQQMTSGELLERLASMGSELLKRDLGRYVDGALIDSPQTSAGVTYAKKIDPAEARLSLSSSVAVLLREINGFNPRPGAYFELDGRRFKIWRAGRSSTTGLEVGELAIVDGALCVGLTDGSLTLSQVQSEGGRRMAAMEWARGRQTPLGRLA